MQLVFDRGTLLLRGNLTEENNLPGILWDARVHAWRAPACQYADLAAALDRRDIDYLDEVRPRLGHAPSIACPELRPYQAAAVAAWERANRRGVIALPTGAGKTRVAVAVIAITRLRTLCLVPTRVLMAQWVKVLDEAGAGPVGEYGDGRRIEQPITVATYASTLRHVETLGNRFDLLVIDEVHHFGSGAGDEVLEMCTAAARLGLSATLPDDAGRQACLEALVGPEVYRASVEELAGRYLAAFELITISIRLTASERAAYEAEMAVFRPVCHAFFQAAPGVSWSDFVAAAGRSDEGRRAISAWRRSRAIVRYSAENRAAVADLLLRHRESHILVFAADSQTAYAIARDAGVEVCPTPAACENTSVGSA